MKIIKRDGRIVDYDRDKIRIAIHKANAEVSECEKIQDNEIENIIDFIENLNKKRMLVEDIQDIIEEKLMELGKYTLAKIYIIYRYKRSIIRQSNTTDITILSLLKNNNNESPNYLTANKQRDIMAGEASKDLAYRLLLPKNVTLDDKENRLKFCNIEYFTEPVIESAKINVEDMFANGTVINGVRIQEPKSFQSACNVLVEIIAAVAACQTGNIYVEIKSLYKYYFMTFEKKYQIYNSLMKSSLSSDEIRALTRTQTFLEVKSGIQTLFYQINTITLANGLVPRVFFLIDDGDILSQAEESIVYEFVKQKNLGIQDEENKTRKIVYPEIIYGFNNENERYSYIGKELILSDGNFMITNSKTYKDLINYLNKFNQGSIILNLAHLALESDKNEEVFKSLLVKTLEHVYEGMMCRNHNLQGVYSKKSPIHWMHGGISRLNSNDKIDELLKNKYSFMSLIVVGFEGALAYIEKSQNLKKEICNIIEEKVKSWNNESSFEIVITNNCDSNILNFLENNDSVYFKKEVNKYIDSFDFMKDNYFKNTIKFCYVDSIKESYLIDGFVIKKYDKN